MKKKKLNKKKSKLQSKKEKRTKRIIIGVLILLLGIGIFYIVDKHNKSYHANNLSFKYEILDNSVVINKDVTNWIDKKSKEEGAYSLQMNNNEYILISQGSEDYNICLNNVLENSNSIKVEYQYIKSNNKDSKPQPMLIQIDNTSKSVRFSKM